MDGKIHDFQKEYDYQRELVLKGLRLNVMRIKNEEVQNIDVVLNRIAEFVGI